MYLNTFDYYCRFSCRYTFAFRRRIKPLWLYEIENRSFPQYHHDDGEWYLLYVRITDRMRYRCVFIGYVFRSRPAAKAQHRPSSFTRIPGTPSYLFNFFFPKINMHYHYCGSSPPNRGGVGVFATKGFRTVRIHTIITVYSITNDPLKTHTCHVLLDERS